MSDRTPRVVNITPDHPRPSSGQPSSVELAFDPGYKSGKLIIEKLTPDRAFELAEHLIRSARIVKRVNEERAAER